MPNVTVTGERKGRNKLKAVMREYGAGELHSGSKRGPVVTSRKQAIAIGLSEQRKAGRKKRGRRK